MALVWDAGAGRSDVASGRKIWPLLVGSLIAVCALAALDLTIDAARTVKALGDTDDATRLIQVRELLAGAPWQDTTLPRFGAPDFLVSHWSRLIDLPLALLISLLSPLLGVAGAEQVTRFVWPLLVLLPLVMVLANAAERRSGPAGAFIAMGLAVTCLSGLQQFMPGRIDHHNGMILCAVAGFLFLARSIEEPRFGMFAGASLALGTAIGYEALALTVAGLGAHALFVLVTRRGERGLVAAASALAVGLLALWLLTTAPSRLFVSHCDALSFNLVVLTGAAAASLWLVIAGPAARLPLAGRLAVVASVSALGLLAYVAAEPKCLKGPFGELDPRIGPLWLADVMETQSLAWMLRTLSGVAAAFVVTAGLGIWSAWRLWRQDRDDAALMSLMVLALAVLLACWQIKLVPYASFLAIVPAAALIGRLPDMRGVSAPVVRTIVAGAASQFFLIVAAQPLVAAVITKDTATVAWMERAKTCIASKTVTPMAALPPGLVFSDRDLAPFIAALTPNRVVAAPYHRLDKAIVATHEIFFGPEDEAGQRLKQLGVTYVAICEGLTPPVDKSNLGKGLYGALTLGRAPAYLEPISLAAETPLKVWRLR